LPASCATAATWLSCGTSEQRLDAAGLAGRLDSSSFAPPPGSPLHEPMLEALASIFRAHARDREIAIEYETILWCGKLT
jgi:hypothetical protein